MLQGYFDTVVLDSGNDHEEKEFMQFPNIYYSGLVNEMKRLSEKKKYKWIAIIPSDITMVSDESVLFDKIKWLVRTKNIGLWQPSLDRTSRNWADNMHTDKYNLEEKKVLEAHFLFIKDIVLEQMNYIDTDENKYGYGVSEILAGISIKNSLGNVYDNTIQIHHPAPTGYNINNAVKQSSKWTPLECEKQGLSYEYLTDIYRGHNSLGEFEVEMEENN